MRNFKALVILSGGQDSVTSLFWAKRKFYGNVEAISFNYGQNHSVELDCAKEICKKYGIGHTIVDIPFFKHLIKSELVKPGGDVNRLNDKGLPSSFVPNRNALFITLAHAYAQTIGADALVTGVCQTDFSGYPDCRQDFISKMESALNSGANTSTFIMTPIMNINKAETFKLAENLGVLQEVIEGSHTCYNGARDTLHAWGYGCGTCPACELRKAGYEKYFAEKV